MLSNRVAVALGGLGLGAGCSTCPPGGVLRKAAAAAGVAQGTGGEPSEAARLAQEHLAAISEVSRRERVEDSSCKISGDVPVRTLAELLPSVSWFVSMLSPRPCRYPSRLETTHRETQVKGDSERQVSVANAYAGSVELVSGRPSEAAARFACQLREARKVTPRSDRTCMSFA